MKNSRLPLLSSSKTPLLNSLNLFWGLDPWPLNPLDHPKLKSFRSESTRRFDFGCVCFSFKKNSGSTWSQWIKTVYFLFEDRFQLIFGGELTLHSKIESIFCCFCFKSFILYVVIFFQTNYVYIVSTNIYYVYMNILLWLRHLTSLCPTPGCLLSP